VSNISDKLNECRIKKLLFLIIGESVAIKKGQETEENEIEQQFSVNKLVQGTTPHKQKPGESTAGGTGDLVLIRDCHLLSI